MGFIFEQIRHSEEPSLTTPHNQSRIRPLQPILFKLSIFIKSAQLFNSLPRSMHFSFRIGSQGLTWRVRVFVRDVDFGVASFANSSSELWLQTCFCITSWFSYPDDEMLT
jgi:hypothetical protein